MWPCLLEDLGQLLLPPKVAGKACSAGVLCLCSSMLPQMPLDVALLGRWPGIACWQTAVARRDPCLKPSPAAPTLQASLKEMIAPGALVLVTPLVVGILFGTRTLAGLLAGALVSGVQMAVSMSNTGGAWDNAKKMIEVGLAVLLPGCACMLMETSQSALCDRSGRLAHAG